MALQILLATLYSLSVAVVVWTVVSVLRHGFRVTAIDRTTRRRYTKASRVVMWWLFSCAVLFIATGITGSFGLFGVTLLVFVIGGLAAGSYVGKTAAYSDEDLQSCLSLKITSGVALFMGSSLLAAPLGAYLFRHPESEGDLVDLLAVEAFALPIAIGLIWESFRLWKKALAKSFQDGERSAYDTSFTYPYGYGHVDRRWWISRVIGKGRSPRSSRSSRYLRIGEKRPHFVKVPKKR